MQSSMREVAFALGVPTAIGSLPHHDRDEAVSFVLERLPELPAAPSLPALHRRESMIAQAAWGINGISISDGGAVTVDPGGVDPDAPLGDPTLDGPAFATLQRFLLAVAGRAGPIKLQLTGPVTLGLVLQAAGVAPALAFRIAGSAVRERALQLLALAEALAPGTPLVVFIDEPGLAADLPLGVGETIDLVSGALAAIEPRAVTGLHCCGAADWRVLLQAGPQILSLPVDVGGPGLVASAGALASFIEQGGWVAWGAVPTDGPLGGSAGRLWRVLSTLWCSLVQSGCDPAQLRRQAMMTPACGLALHSVAQATEVLDLTRRVADHLHDQMLGVKLSVGA